MELERLEEETKKARIEARKSELRRRGLDDQGVDQVAEALEILKEAREGLPSVFQKLEEGYRKGELFEQVADIIKVKESMIELMEQVQIVIQTVVGKYESLDIAVQNLDHRVTDLEDEIRAMRRDMDTDRSIEKDKWVRKAQTLDLIDGYIKRNM